MPKTKWWWVAIILFLIFIIYDQIRISNYNKKYLINLNLVLTGIVESVDLSYIPNGFGVVKVNVIKSNINYYDPRNDHKYYYCLIKNSQAEFYQHALYECEIGDTIEVNTRERIFIIRNDGKRIQEEIILYDNDKFYDYVRQKHQKF